MKFFPIVASMLLVLSACQLPGVKEVEEKVNSMSGQLTQLRNAGDGLSERVEELESRLGDVRVPGTGGIEMPDFGAMIQDVSATVEQMKLEVLAEVLSGQEQLDSLLVVITTLEERLDTMSARITTLENRPAASSGSSSSGGSSRGSSTEGRGGSTGGSTGGR